MILSAKKQVFLRYAFAVFAVLLATQLRVLLTPLIQDRLPFATYTIAVMSVAWVGGALPAVLALALSTICAAQYIIPPEGSLRIEHMADQIALLIFFVIGVASIVLFHRLDFQRSRALVQAIQNEQLNNKLREQDLRKDEFLSLLAHELRSPLAPMGNALTLAEKCADNAGEIRNLFKIVARHFSHLTRLVDDLLDVSRYLRGSIVIRPEIIDLKQCIHSAIEICHSELTSQRHELLIDLPEQPTFVRADRVRCCQIIANLVSNAIKYTPEGGRICISIQLGDEGIEIAIQDNGLGVPRAIREQIFEPFFQANSKQSRFASGLGLGLSIVKKLVELHGGTVLVQSDGMNAGSRFVVVFPSSILVAGPHSPKTPDESMQNPVATSPLDHWGRNHRWAHDRAVVGHPLGETGDPTSTCSSIVLEPPANSSDKPRVLIVDDDLDTAVTLGRIIQLEGFPTETATSGLLALKTIHSFRPDILLLDIGLPELNGFQIARRLKACSSTRHIKIIAISGWGSEHDVRVGTEAGFSVHLVKPVDLHELLPHLALGEPTRQPQNSEPLTIH